jgi:hypothetical protein
MLNSPASREILEVLTPLCGIYTNNGVPKLAVSETYALNQTVLGLEAVVKRKNTNVQRFMGGASSSTVYFEVYLTQHEGGRNTIREAESRLLELGFSSSSRELTLSAQNNVERIVISIGFLCAC